MKWQFSKVHVFVVWVILTIDKLFHISDPPEAPQITGYYEGEAIKAGNVLKMRCTAMRGNPPATLAWFKGTWDCKIPYMCLFVLHTKP